jgi:general secretion pathway protein H
MDKLVVKAKTQTLAVGNKPHSWLERASLAGRARMPAAPTPSLLAGGFTLIELMVVLLVLALCSSLVVMSTRNTAQQTLEREADRLVNVLEAARAQARSNSTALLWQSDAQGYSVRALTDPESQTKVHQWYVPGTRSEPSTWVISAEPVQAAVRLSLLLEGATSERVSIATDGAASYKVMP